MSSAFSIALSSLQAESAAINTTGNNLANMNTNGFKGSAVDFKDLFSNSLGGGTTYSSGLGVTLPVNNQLFTQGAIQTSSAPLVRGHSGRRLFRGEQRHQSAVVYPRWQFRAKRRGELQTETGEAVQGWTAGVNGISTTGAPGNIVLPSDAFCPLRRRKTFQSAPISTPGDGCGSPTPSRRPCRWWIRSATRII